MERKKYNLRSAKSDGVQTTIQQQLLGDKGFLKNLLEVNSPGQSQQVSDKNYSSSEVDCSGLKDTSESDDAITQTRSFDWF